ncbi:MAG TPA: hypothetical protein VG742_09490 [Dongiaceae bacterium]|nr:hypothetical protein [Dongiaceae bacterium]
MATDAKLQRLSHKKPSWRVRLFRTWLLFAAPWLAGVVTLAIHDHLRAIRRVVDLQIIDQALSGVQVAGQWILAARHYSGEAILLYGLLPTGLTFILYVMFLPWADRWSRQGLLED